MKPNSFWRELVVAGGLLALATVGFFWQIILLDNRWMPAGGGDLAPFLYPNYRFAAEWLKQGVIPLWNPHLYSGTPFAADIQTGLFYPINLLVFLLVPNLTYEWLEGLAIFHFWLAGLLMYACLRLLVTDGMIEREPERWQGLAISPPAAFAGALIFAFSDLFIVHFGNLNMIAVAAWLPLVFLLYWHSLVRGQSGYAAGAGAVLAIATLAGHIQITLFILLAIGLLTGYWVVVTFRPEESSYPMGIWKPVRSAWLIRPLLHLALTVLITVALSAIMFLPAYEMSQHTPRAELAYSEAAQYSLHPAQLVGLFVPNYFGRDPALHWGPWQRVETGYIGILPLFLALISLLVRPIHQFSDPAMQRTTKATRRRNATSLQWFFAGLSGLALLLALGGGTVVHGWLYALVPGFGQLRAPARFIFLMDFGLAVLAAYGLQRLLEPLTELARQKLGTLLKILAWGLGGIIAITVPLSYQALLITQDRNPDIFLRAQGAVTGVMIFAGFVVLNLAVLAYVRYGSNEQSNLPSINSGSRQSSPELTESEWRLSKPMVIAGLATTVIALDLFTLGYNVDVGTVDPTTKFDHPEAIEFLRNDPNAFRIEVTTDVWHLWQPDTALLNGLYDVWGLYNPLTLADTTLYWTGAPPRSTGRYNFLGVKYIIASKAGAPADGNIVPVFDADPDINIYLNLDALNRVIFVPQAKFVPDHDAAWQAIREDGFNPRKVVVLEGKPSRPSDLPKTAKPAQLALIEYGLHQATVDVTTERGGYLVMADADYPGWQARVNDEPAMLYRANYAFRAVYVPAGEHRVQFVFAPWLWPISALISGLTLVGLVGWWAVNLRTKPQTQCRTGRSA